MSHFACIGFGAPDADAFEALVAGLVDEAEELPLGAGRHLVAGDASGARVAFHLDGDSITCVTPYYEAPGGGTRLKVTTTTPLDDEKCVHCGGADCDFVGNEGLVTRATVQWLHAAPWRKWLEQKRSFVLELVAFAHRVTASPDRRALEGSLGSNLELADDAFLPVGMLAASASVTQRATALFCGNIEKAARAINEHTGMPFHRLRVATLPGAIDVVADAVDGDPAIGNLALVEAWLVGTPAEPSSPPEGPRGKILAFRRSDSEP